MEQRACDDKKAPVRIILPFKDERSANSVRRELGEFSRKIGKDIHPMYTTQKIGPNIRPKESKPPFVNQQCIVYHFKRDLCDADYVGYTCRYTCVNALKNIRDLPLGNTSEINVGLGPK